MIFLRQINGPSMKPTLAPGRLALFRSKKTYLPGQIVCASLSNKRLIVKRLLAIEAGFCFVAGDHWSSGAYRLPQQAIQGQLVCHFKKLLVK